MTDTGDPVRLIADTLSDSGSPLVALAYLRRTGDTIDQLTRSYVLRARAFGYTWVAIGEALEVTASAVQQRYGGEPETTV